MEGEANENDGLYLLQLTDIFMQEEKLTACNRGYWVYSYNMIGN